MNPFVSFFSSLSVCVSGGWAVSVCVSGGWALSVCVSGGWALLSILIFFLLCHGAHRYNTNLTSFVSDLMFVFVQSQD